MRKLGFLALAACIHPIEDEQPGSRAGVVASDCIVPVAGAGAPTSLEYTDDGVSLWLWDDARALVASAAGACGGVAVRPGSAVPLTADEVAANAARTDGRRIAVSPRGGFVWRGQGYLYYEEQLLGPGFFDVTPIGTGVCVLAARDQPCARTPDLLWTAPARGWGGNGVVAADGYAYVASCVHVQAFTDVCGVARVAPERAASAADYEFPAPFGGWTHDPGNAAVALDGTLLVSPSPGLGRWVAVFPDVWGARLRIAVADGPGGPFGSAVTMFDAVPPSSFFIGGGREHAALRAGDRWAITYSSAPSGLHLVTFRVDPVGWP
jgi:hypothetical protein